MSKTVETRGVRNKNPFNLRHVDGQTWLGEVGHDKDGFCVFDNMFHGIRAGCKLIVNYVEKFGLITPSQIIGRFAPSSENNVDAYVSYISSMVGLTKDQSVTSVPEMTLLCLCIMRYESRYDCTYFFVQDIIRKLLSVYYEKV